MKKAIITTGGTGDIYTLCFGGSRTKKRRDVDIFFLWEEFEDMEKDMVPKENIRFEGLDIYPIKSVKTFFKLLSAVKKSIKLIKEEKPDVSVGIGNYISLPMITATFLREHLFIFRNKMQIWV